MLKSSRPAPATSTSRTSTCRITAGRITAGARIAAIALATVALVAACKDEPKTGPTALPPETGTHDAPHAAPGAPTAGTGASAPGAATAKPARAAVPVETPLPNAAPLTGDSSRRTLLEAVDAAPDAVVVREALLALAQTAGADAVRPAAAKLLAKGDGTGGYADPEGAAAALEALIAAGDAESGAAAVALAKAGIESEDVFPGFVSMLAAVTGTAQPEARRLLVRLADDPVLYSDAVMALAPLREGAAAARLHDVATDADEDAGLRATAACGLLALRDARADGVLEGLVRDTKNDLPSYEVIDGLAVRGVPEALPWMHKIADPIIAEGENCAIELTSLAAGIATIRGAGNGMPEDVTELRKLLGKDDGMCDDEVLAALWTLGDDAQADATANVLAKYVAGAAAVFDEEMPVRLLEAIATRRKATGRPFGRVVDAAAALTIASDPRRPDSAGRAWRVRVAAARAHLASAR
ncbi:MAG: hypothetical protein K8T90_06080 [Planctomycetes bacterium]|nr:hypothetical protein [Planctomycetota bacterium]